MLRNKLQKNGARGSLRRNTRAAIVHLWPEGRSFWPRKYIFFSSVICSLFIVCNFLLGNRDLNVFAQEQPAYDSKGKRDPFIPLVTPDGRLLNLKNQETATGLTLEGIIYDENP